ncbi:MAG: hypothetical protein QOG89_132 [Thermomicrobiales bacterium]|nr:hypothetical protein [Thermomicrobiales bacterium]
MSEHQTDLNATPTTSRRSGLRERLRVPIPSLHRNGVQAPPTPFVIRLLAGGNGLLVTATGSAGRAEATAALPTVDALPREVVDGDTRPWKIATRTGERLFAAVFLPPIARLFEASLQKASDGPMPIVLQIEGEELAALPWELLRDPERERFLALSPRTPLSRAAVRPGSSSSSSLERGNLRVTLLADSVEEDVLAVTSAVGADPRVDIGVNDQLTATALTTSRPHVVLLTANGGANAAVPAGTPLVVVAGDGARTPDRPRGDWADLLVPGTMGSEARVTFAAKLAAALADGRPLDAAVAVARRAVADEHSVVALDWAEPVLVAAVPSRPLVMPARSAAVAAGAEVAARTVGWFRDALAGSVSAVLFLIAGVLVYRLGFSTSNEIALDLLSPFELFSTFKGMILALSTYQDRVLLIIAGILLLLTAVVGVLWLRNRRIEPEEQPSLAARFAGPLTGVRALSFLTIATATIAGAYAYQQYLWRVVLPIPTGALGIAITREAAAASIENDLAGVLYAQGQTGRIVVRDLPVAFDAGDTDKARALGKRIGAKAVLIYREIDRGEAGKQYGAYMVFTDPGAGLTIGGSSPESESESGQGEQAAASSVADLVQVREGVEIPALRTDTVTELVAGAAGVIAYNENRLREAIILFQQAVPQDPSAPNTGMLNFYLGDALRLDSQAEPAAVALERAIGYYETRQNAAVPLSPQDELILAKSYFTRGWIAAEIVDEGWEAAIGWYTKALPLRDGLLARSGQLDRPATVRATFARIYTHLAESNRRLERTDEQKTWVQRAKDELDALEREAPANDPSLLAQQATSRFFIGDCTAALSALRRIQAIEPDNVDAAIGLGIISMFQSRPDLATASWQQALAIRPNDERARAIFANLMAFRAFGNGRYLEPVYLARAEALRREILAIDPANERAHEEIADSAEIRAGAALLDTTADVRGDDLTARKSTQLWPKDPERRAVAIAALDIEIQERRILATEIHPNDPGLEIALAEAYDNRQYIYYQAIPVLDPNLDVNDPIIKQAGEGILADAKEIREWTDRVLAPDSGATRVDRLRAWSVAIGSASREWAWALARGDMETVYAIVEERQRLLAGALVDVGAAPLTTIDEAGPMFAIYIEGYLLALFAGDTETAATYQTKMAEVAAWQRGQMQTVRRLDDTFCSEERERIAGDEARTAGDLDGARTRYEAALAENPEQVFALTGLAAVLVAQGDAEGATANATKATTVWPDAPAGWTSLAQARLAAGDSGGAETALARLLELTSPLPPQEQMSDVRDAIEAISSLVKTHPDRAPLVAATVPTFAGALDAMPAEFAKTYQYSQLYAQLGAMALHADDGGRAEPLLRRSLELDPHQADAHADLALAVLAQDRDAAAEIEAGIVDSRHEVWQWDASDPTAVPRQLLAMMTARVEEYVARFPDRAAMVRPLEEAIAAELERLDSGGSGNSQ